MKRKQKKILNGMARDYFQRNNLDKGLAEVLEDDLMLISDLDEIPDLKKLNFEKINNNIILFEQKMFYYKLNLLYDDFVWLGTKAIKKKFFKSPQWLRNIKGKKYPFWRLDTYFSKKIFKFVIYKEWRLAFYMFKDTRRIRKKLLNFAHHYEYEESGLNLSDLKKLINEKRVMYDHNIDQRGYKWSGKSILKRTDLNDLPEHVIKNVNNTKIGWTNKIY